MKKTADKLTLTEAARYFHTSRQNVNQWVLKGLLPAERLGRRMIFVWRKDVERFVPPSLRTTRTRGRILKHSPLR